MVDQDRRRRQRRAQGGTEYVAKLFEAGETDPHRLTVCGLTCLRELDGSVNPVKAGFTGL